MRAELSVLAVKAVFPCKAMRLRDQQHEKHVGKVALRVQRVDVLERPVDDALPVLAVGRRRLDNVRVDVSQA